MSNRGGSRGGGGKGNPSRRGMNYNNPNARPGWNNHSDPSSASRSLDVSNWRSPPDKSATSPPVVEKPSWARVVTQPVEPPQPQVSPNDVDSKPTEPKSAPEPKVPKPEPIKPAVAKPLPTSSAWAKGPPVISKQRTSQPSPKPKETAKPDTLPSKATPPEPGADTAAPPAKNTGTSWADDDGESLPEWFTKSTASENTKESPHAPSGTRQSSSTPLASSFSVSEAVQILDKRVNTALKALKDQKHSENNTNLAIQYIPPKSDHVATGVGLLHDGKSFFVDELERISKK